LSVTCGYPHRCIDHFVRQLKPPMQVHSLETTMITSRNNHAMPTSRNARGIDIVAYSTDASRFIGIQVKSLSKVSPVPLGKTLDNIMGHLWIIVNNVNLETPSTFILLPDEVRERAHRKTIMYPIGYNHVPTIKINFGKPGAGWNAQHANF